MSAIDDDITRADIHRLLRRRNIYWDDLIYVVPVGSNVHGVAVEGYDDRDYAVIRMEPFDEMIVGNPKRQSMQIRTAAEGERSGPDDIDLQVYTLRKYVDLLLGGNPSIINCLWAPEPLWHPGSMFLLSFWRTETPSKRAGQAYLGYMRQQIERWRGERGQKNVSRPELVEKYGYDTKYAFHAIRLGLQGVEYLNTGIVTLPVPEPDRTGLLMVRNGEHTEEDALDWAQEVEEELKQALEDSQLPDRVEWGAPNDMNSIAYHVMEKYGWWYLHKNYRTSFEGFLYR